MDNHKDDMGHGNNDHHVFHEDQPHTNDMPEHGDARAPQLDKVKCRSRIGCACTSSRANGKSDSEGGGGGGGKECGCVHDGKEAVADDNGSDARGSTVAGDGCTSARADYCEERSHSQPSSGSAAASALGSVIETIPTLTDDNGSDAGSCESVDGDEGADEKIEVGDLGHITFREMWIAVARHHRCTCVRHLGALPNADDYPFSGGVRSPSPAASMVNSMMAEDGSADTSMTSSVALSELLGRSTSPAAMLAQAGAWHYEDRNAPLKPQVPHHWLWLTPITAVSIPAGMEYDIAYPMEMSFTEESDGRDALEMYRGYDLG